MKKIAEYMKDKLFYWLITIVCFAAFIFCMVYGAIGLSKYLKEKNTVYTPETAVIDRYEEKENFWTANGNNLALTYCLYYKYEAPDGTVYSGIKDFNIGNEDYAKREVGKTFTIYVDHVNKTHKRYNTIDIGSNWQSFVIGLIPLVAFVNFLLKLLKFYKKTDQSDESFVAEKDSPDNVDCEEGEEVVAKKAKRKNRYKTFSKKWAFIHFAVVVISFLFVVLMTSNMVFATKSYLQQAKGNYVIENATIVKYTKFQQNSNSRRMDTYYEYVSQEGVVYTGLWGTFYDEADAIAQLGEQVQIYVDHQARICTESIDVSWGGVAFASVVSLVFYSVMINSLVRLLLYLVNWYKFKIKNKSEARG